MDDTQSRCASSSMRWHRCSGTGFWDAGAQIIRHNAFAFLLRSRYTGEIRINKYTNAKTKKVRVEGAVKKKKQKKANSALLRLSEEGNLQLYLKQASRSI